MLDDGRDQGAGPARARPGRQDQNLDVRVGGDDLSDGALGVAGFCGTTLIGLVLKRSLYGTLAGIALLMAVIALALIPAGTWLLGVALLLALWGFIATAAPVGWWSWIAHALPEHAEAGGGLMVAIVQLSIAVGSTVGDVLFDSLGYQSTFIASAAALLVAALLIALTARSHGHRTP